MPWVKTLNISLTPTLHLFITDCVASDRYGTVSEVVRAALRVYERLGRENLLPVRSKNQVSQP